MRPSHPYRVDDVVRLNRAAFRGKFKDYKGRVGKIARVINLKTPLTTYRRVTIYRVQGIDRARDLRLLASDLLPAEPDDWAAQELVDRLTQ